MNARVKVLQSVIWTLGMLLPPLPAAARLQTGKWRCSTPHAAGSGTFAGDARETMLGKSKMACSQNSHASTRSNFTVNFESTDHDCNTVTLTRAVPYSKTVLNRKLHSEATIA
eukprot:5769754-Amphidinium_carterae.1